MGLMIGKARTVTSGAYVGIPAPTDPVPLAIMPTLPTGANFTNHEWIDTYDPLTVANPTAPATVTANEYVVDKFHGSATDADEGDNAISGTVYGTTAKPRLTPPTSSTYAAGTKIFLYGDNTALPTQPASGQQATVNRKVDYDQWDADEYTHTFNGTSGNPCWVVGINKPRVAVDKLRWDNSTHTIVDGVYLEEPVGVSEGGRQIFSSLQYFTFRNGGQYGDHIGSGHQACPMSGTAANPCQFVVYYNNEMAYFGLYDDLPVSILGPKPTNDVHGLRPFRYCRYHWYIGNHIHHIGADACQIANSVNTWGVDEFVAAARPHYMYFAGNDCHHLGENAFDCKNSYHCIASENLIYDTDEALMLMPNDGEGTLSAYHWSLCNDLHKTDTNWGNQNNFLIGMQGDHDGAYGASIGNFIHDHSGPGINLGFGDPTTPNRQYVINNTFSRCTTGINVNQFQNSVVDHLTELQGNIVLDCTTGIDVQSAGGGALTLNVIDNEFFGCTTNIDDTAGPFIDSETGTLTTDPNMVDDTSTAVANFTPQAPSAAIDGTTEHGVFQAFEDLYGITLREDILGNTWLSTDTNINIGAVQDEA